MLWKEIRTSLLLLIRQFFINRTSDEEDDDDDVGRRRRRGRGKKTKSFSNEQPRRIHLLKSKKIVNEQEAFLVAH